MTTVKGGILVLPDGTINASIKVDDMPKYNTMSIYLIYNGKAITGVSKYNRLYAKTIGTNPDAIIKISSPSGWSSLISSNVDYTITINHRFPQLKGVNPEKVYIKISFWVGDLQSQSRKPAYITTQEGTKACKITLNTFKLNSNKTYTSSNSIAIKDVESGTSGIENYAGGKYSLTVYYTKPISFVLAHNITTRPDGQPANSVYMQFSDFLKGYMWSRVHINSKCQISPESTIVYWVKYTAVLKILKKPPSSNVIPSIKRDFEDIFHIVNTPELILGIVALFLIAKVLSEVIP